MSRIKSNAGITLLSTLISIGILSIMAFVVFKVISDNKMSAMRADLTELSSENASRSIQKLYISDFYDIVSYCTEKQALGKTRTGSCVTSGKLLSKNSKNEKDIQWGLEQPLDSRGLLTKEPAHMCVEIYKCDILASGHLLEVQLKQFLISPGTTTVIQGRPRTFRKTRW